MDKPKGKCWADRLVPIVPNVEYMRSVAIKCTNAQITTKD